MGDCAVRELQTEKYRGLVIQAGRKLAPLEKAHLSSGYSRRKVVRSSPLSTASLTAAAGQGHVPAQAGLRTGLPVALVLTRGLGFQGLTGPGTAMHPQMWPQRQQNRLCGEVACTQGQL